MRAFAFHRGQGNDREVLCGQVLVKLTPGRSMRRQREKTQLLYPMSCPAVE